MRYKTMNTGLVPAPSERQAFLEARFSEDYFSFQYIFIEFFIEHLSAVSRELKGDLQQMLVLALIGQMHLRWVKECGRKGIQPTELPAPEASISASRIADCTGIPRETVRRKLLLLQEQRWVDRNPDGRWRLQMSEQPQLSQAHLDFAAVDENGKRRIAKMVARLEELADKGRL